MQIKDFTTPPAISSEANDSAEQFYELLPDHVKVLVIHPDTGVDKMWKEEHWIALLDRFLSKNEEFLVVAIGLRPTDFSHSKHRRRIIECYGAPLTFALAILERATVFVGVDSCMLHAADMFKIPSVGIFGPTRPAEFGFRYSERHCCIEGRGSLDGIAPETVFSALSTLVSH